MAWKLKYRCRQCGYEAEVYEGRGLFRQEITAMTCPDCQTIQNIVDRNIIEKYEAYCIYIHNGSLVIMLMPS